MYSTRTRRYWRANMTLCHALFATAILLLLGEVHSSDPCLVCRPTFNTIIFLSYFPLHCKIYKHFLYTILLFNCQVDHIALSKYINNMQSLRFRGFVAIICEHIPRAGEMSQHWSLQIDHQTGKRLGFCNSFFVWSGMLISPYEYVAE